MNPNSTKPPAPASSTEYADKTINCPDCRVDFTFTARDQEFYASQDPPYQPPRRCKPCRDLKKAQREGRDGGFNSRGGYNSPSTPEPNTTVAYRDPGDRRGDGGGGRKPSGKRKRFEEFED